MIKPSQTGKVLKVINRRLEKIGLAKSAKFKETSSAKTNSEIRKLINSEQNWQDAKSMLADKNALIKPGGTRILRKFAKIKGIGQ